jgi:CheY-like chemotaxis protein
MHEVKQYRNLLYEQMALNDARLAADSASNQTVETVIGRYEELLKARDMDLIRLREAIEEKAVKLVDLQAALGKATEESENARKTLGLARAAHDSTAINEAIHAESSIRRILHLEPDLGGGTSMANLLRRTGFDVTHVRTSAEAADLLQCSSFDLLLAEIHRVRPHENFIPYGSAAPLLREAKQRGVPVVALTVLDRDEFENSLGHHREIEQGLSQWVDVHLSKPVDFSTVLTAIRSVARHRSRAD